MSIAANTPSTDLSADSHAGEAGMNTKLSNQVAKVCAGVAPTWPLDRFIAVNPFWSRIDKPLPEVAAGLGAACGTRLLMPRAWYLEHWKAGAFDGAHLRAAIERAGSETTVAQLEALLQRQEAAPPRRLRVVDVLDAQRDLDHEMPWAEFVVHTVSQFCAAFFDEGQAQIGAPAGEQLYAAWLHQAKHDKSPSLLMGMKGYDAIVECLPATHEAMIAKAIAALDIPEAEVESYLTSVLLSVNGWASWGAYRRWIAAFAEESDDSIEQLLAVLLAWEWMLFETGGSRVAKQWQLAMASWPRVAMVARASGEGDWLVHRAFEIAWQEKMAAAIADNLAASCARATVAALPGKSMEAVFCIDVRSERMRRNLEALDPSIRTRGFAGFFGMPVEYLPVGTAEARPQLPALLAPRMRVTDTGTPSGLSAHRAESLEVLAAWKKFRTGAVSSFSFVESMGVFFAGSLVADAFHLSRSDADADHAGLAAEDNASRKPRLTSFADGREIGAADRAQLAAGILRAMSMTDDFARLVVLVGHRSSTSNNPHAAGLDCGACGGQSGEVNARAAAALLNDPQVRAGLVAHEIVVPATTRFVAGLHDTTTDEITLFDVEELPSSHLMDIAKARGWFAQAGSDTRRERAASLGAEGLSDKKLLAALQKKTRNWAEVRPEWGLAGNAAMVVAPRERTRALNLEGRCFLHEYRCEEDDDRSVLELIMTAPMVVAHWINMQYFASTVDNRHFGSGNKVLHNVVGGHLGVFEGNGGDLRIGLPMQSLHDGEKWMHSPQRLSVFIEAPAEAIDAIVAKHETLGNLVGNGWVHLFRIDPESCAVHARGAQGWSLVAEAPAPEPLPEVPSRPGFWGLSPDLIGA